MSDQLAQIRAQKSAEYAARQNAQTSVPSSTPKATPAPQTPIARADNNSSSAVDNLALLQDVLVKVDFLVPDQEKASTTFSLNPIFPLRTALGQICSRNVLDLKKTRLWKVGKNGADEVLDLDKTPSEAKVQSNETLIVEVQRSDGQWIKISPADAKSKSNEDVIRGVLNKIANQAQNQGSSLKRNHGDTDRDPYQFEQGNQGSNKRGNFGDSGAYQTLGGPSSNLGNAMDVDDDLQRALEISKAQAVVDQRKYEGVENRLASQSLRIVTMENDGNCLFSAVSLQVLGSAADHEVIRAMAISHMVDHPEKFYPFITGEFDVYISTLSILGEYGTHVEIQALSDVLQRPFEIHSDVASQKDYTIVGEEFFGINEPIRLSYHRGNHYNAVLPI